MRLNFRKKNNGKYGKLMFLILFFSGLYYFFNESVQLFYIEAKNSVYVALEEKEKILLENRNLIERIEKMELEALIKEEYGDSFLDVKKVKTKYGIALNEDNFFKGRIINDHKNNIKIGDKVYFYDNVLYGMVDNITDNFIFIENFSNNNFKNNFAILVNDEVVFRGAGRGISNGEIKIDLPRSWRVETNALLILDDGSNDIVGRFERDDYKKQESKREVIFKLFKNPYTVYQIEI